MCLFSRQPLLPALVLLIGLAPAGEGRGQPLPVPVAAPQPGTPQPATSQPATPQPATPQPAEAPQAPEKTLQFNFQRQPWGEVLQWLADEADLSLVLDAPPPGSFNYTDAKAYSTVEAIDLVNGILASKGYSLLRRERMLMLINLQDEVPRTLVPRETLENVDRRGKYEFVTVAFPLEGRSAEAALAEIQPLISEFGHASALPASGQLIVTDRAGLMRVIATVVESIPKPPASTTAPPAQKETPVFRVYGLQGGDAAAAVEILEAVVDGKFVHDPGGDRINAFATPSQHSVIEQLMEQVRGAAGQQRFRLEIYPIEGLTAVRQTELVTDLKIVAADAQMRFDAANGQLVVWANDQQHLELRRALLNLLAAGAGSSRQAAQVYQLEHAETADLIPLLQAAVPEARVLSGGSPRRVVAIAGRQEQQLIDQLLASLDRVEPSDPLTIKEYRVEQDPPAELAALLASAAPDAKIRVDASRGSVLATGTAEDQRRVAAALAGVQGNLQPKPELDLVIYALSPLQQERFADVRASIEQTAPESRVVWNEKAGELFVWAIPDEQTTIERLLQSLGDTPRRPATPLTIKEYRVEQDPPAELAALLASAAPDAKIRVDASRGSVLATGTAEDQRLVAAALESVEGNLRPQPERDLAIYTLTPLQHERFADVRSSIEQTSPEARLVWNENSGELFVWAAPDEQATVSELLQSLGDTPRRPKTQQFRAYPTPLRQLDAMSAMIAQVAPKGVLTVDRTGRRLLVWADAEDHQRIEPVLQAAAAASPASSDPMIYHAYPAAGVDLTVASRLLSEVFPDAEIESDATARTIIASATAADHSEIEAMLSQLREGNEHTVTVYPLGNVAQAQAEGLRPLFPSMRISVDPETNQMIAWGSREDHRQFHDALRSLGGTRAAGVWQVRTFSLKQARASEVAAGLQQLMPGVSAAAVNQSQLLVRCYPDLEPRVAELISQLDVSRTLRKDQKAQVFSVRFADPLALRTTLEALFPLADGAHFSYDAQTRSMVAVADPEAMDLVEAVIAAADRRDGAEDGDRLLRVHALSGVDATIALQTLQELFEARGARPLLSIDRMRNRLVAVATAAEQQIVDDLLASLAPAETELQVFSLETMDPLTAELAIRQLFGGVSNSDGSPVDIESDEDGGRILVRATPAQLAEIRSLLRQLGEVHLHVPAATDQTTRFIPWQVADQAQALEQLQATWRQLRSNELRITNTEPSPLFSPAATPAKKSLPANRAEETPSGAVRPAAGPAELTPAETPAAAAQTQSPGEPSSPDHNAPDSPRPDDAPAPESTGSSSPPVFLHPGPEGVTITSEDGAALDQLAVLLRTYGRGSAATHSDIGVFPLQNSSAGRVAAVLTDIYRRSGRGIHFAADERLNAVIAQGTRSERREVEALLQTLDTAQTTDFFKPNQPVMLMLRHASAKQVHQQLQTLYRTELDRGKRQPPIEIPPGADPELVATLEQINASREGPLLSLEVDIDSNSIMLIAPRPLLEEIRQFVAQVDVQSTKSRVGVRVIPLEAMQGDEILRSLEQIIMERR